MTWIPALPHHHGEIPNGEFRDVQEDERSISRGWAGSGARTCSEHERAARRCEGAFHVQAHIRRCLNNQDRVLGA